jgi:hypothetical protein
MNALTQTTTLMNAALVSRGLMPMDGHCTCTHCDKSGLDRSDIHVFGRFDRVCETCRPMYRDDRQITCTCGHDKINHSGPWAFVECYHCAQKPRASETATLPDMDAYLSIMDGVEVSA